MKYIFLIFILYLILPLNIFSQEINEDNQIILRTVQDGTNDIKNIRVISNGEVVSDVKYLFIIKKDTIVYHPYFDFSQIIQNSSFVILFNNDTITIPNIDKYICKGYKFMIEISYDLLNTNPNNILISSNRRSCGDLYIADDKTDINSGYHLIRLGNYKN